MDGSQAGDGSRTPDGSRAALDLAHRLLSRTESSATGLDGVASEMRAAFGARAAGIADLQSGQPLVARRADNNPSLPTVLPWEIDADLLTRIRQSPNAQMITGGNDAFLVATVTCPAGGGWLLWISDAPQTEWTVAEKGALVLLGHSIAGRMSDPANSGRWGRQLERSVHQQHLEQAAALARRLAHDFGNVLTGILGFSELALAQPQPVSGPLYRFIDEIYRSAQAGAQLTHQLQLFSRRQATSYRDGSLAAVVAEEENRFRAAAKGVRWESSIPSDLPLVVFDVDPLRDVLGAVLDNAREAVGNQGTVTVSAQSVVLTESDCLEHYGCLRPGPHVEVCVRDSGPGLSDEAKHRLFVEPFFTSKARRRGFGLAVAYGVLSAHHGGLSISSEPGEGVLVRILVPAATLSVPIIAAATEPSLPPTDEKVLVVDDDPMILQFVSVTLEQAGYRVKAVNNATDALDCYAAAGADPFQLVLSDVIMPRVNGVDLARKLLTRDANARILFMSGQVSPDFAHKEFADRKIDLLSKPFRPEGLLQAVRGALDRDTPDGPKPLSLSPLGKQG